MEKKTFVSFLESLLLVLLLIAMLVQCVFFINLTQNKQDRVLPPFPESEMKFVTSGGLESAGNEKYAVIPYFVGAVSDKGKYGGLFNDELGYEVFECFVNALEYSFDGTAKKIAYSDVVKKYEYLDELYTNTKNCYYVKLQNEIEFSVLCRLLQDTYTGIPENPDFVIEDMFLVEGASNETNIIAVNSNGDVLKIYPSKNIPFNKEYLETYNNTEKDEFEFVKINGNFDGGRNGYFPAFKYSIKYRTIVKSAFSEQFDLVYDSADINNIVGIFGMNNDNTRFYKRTSDGTMICVEDITSLEIKPDGEFIFLAGDSGTNLEKIIDGSVGTEYGFFEYASAAKKISDMINRLVPDCIGKLLVENISYDDGKCSFRYNYTVNGVPVESDRDYALELIFEEDKIVSAKGCIEFFKSDIEARTEIPQKTAYILMNQTIGPVSYFGPEFCYSEVPGENGKAYIKWTVKYEKNDGGMQK